MGDSRAKAEEWASTPKTRKTPPRDSTEAPGKQECRRLAAPAGKGARLPLFMALEAVCDALLMFMAFL